MTTASSNWAHNWLLGANGLHMSPNGTHWEEIGKSGYPVHDIIREPHKIFCATMWGLWEIATPTAQWIQLHDETLTEVMSIAPCADHPGVAAASTYGLSFGKASAHGATQWQNHSENLTLNECFSNALLALPDTQDQWLIGTEQGVLMYDKKTHQWQSTELNTYPCRALLHAHGRLWAGTDGGGIWHSTNGKTWQKAGTGIDDESVFSLCATTDLILAGTLRGIFMGDGTSGWQQSGPAVLVSAIAAHPNQQGPWFAGANPGGLWRSDNNGVHWHQVGNFHTVRVIIPPEETP